MPTSHSPSRRVPGCGSALVPAEALGARRARPRRCGARRRAGPRSGSFSGSLRMRSSIGSMPSCSASSSIAHSSAKVPTDSPGARMKVLASMSMSATCTSSLKLPAAYRRCVGQDERLGQVVVRGHRRHAGVDQRVEAAVRLRADRDALLGRGAPADDAVDALARQRDPHRPPGQLGRGGGEDLVLPQRLAAEAAADIGRGDVDLLLVAGRTPARATRPSCVHRLRGVVDDQLVAVPGERRRVQLDRVVVVARRAVGGVDLVRRGGERRLGVADLVAQRLAQERRRACARAPWPRRTTVTAGSAS